MLSYTSTRQVIFSVPRSPHAAARSFFDVAGAQHQTFERSLARQRPLSLPFQDHRGLAPDPRSGSHGPGALSPFRYFKGLPSFPMS